MRLKQSNWLLLATDPVLSELCDAAAEIIGDDANVTRIFAAEIGAVLRPLHLNPPDAMFVCTSPAQMLAGASLIEQLRRRRPQAPILAIAQHHDEQLERAVRSAGASCYCLLHSEHRELLLRHAMEAIGLVRSPVAMGVTRAPPPALVRRRRRLRDGPHRICKT